MSKRMIHNNSLCLFITIAVIVLIDNIKLITSQVTDNIPFDFSSETNWPSLCKNGLHNSPINFPLFTEYNNYINTTDYVKVHSSNYAYVTNKKLSWINNQKYGMTFENGGQLILSKNGTNYAYNLIEISIKYLSEHKFNGVSGDLEIQLLHSKDTQYLTDNEVIDADPLMKYLTLSLLCKSNGNSDNDFLNKLNIGISDNITDLNFNQYVVKKFMNDDFYFYQGSLTNPDCEENVYWMVLADFGEISIMQLSKIKTVINEIYPNGNAREVKPLSDRSIYYIKNSENNFLFFAIIIFMFYSILVYFLLKKYFI